MDRPTTGEGEFLPGTSYRLVRLLGEGAHGRVYLGEHVELRAPVVLKVIQQKYAAREEVVRRLRREARILARVSHDALTAIRDLGTATDGRAFFVMSFVEGVSLREALRTRGSLPIVVAGPLAIEALGGLQAAHEQGVIHRDLKPENLLLTSTGHLKILDFGIAKVIQETEGSGTRTAHGIVLGTPRYMPPEQARGRPLSPATDIYNMGLVLFEMVAGSPAFEGASAQELIYAHMETAPPTLSARLGIEVDGEFEEVIARALRKEPSDRFDSAQQMAASIQRVVDRLRARVSQSPPAAGDHISHSSQAAGATARPIEVATTERDLTKASPLGTPTSLEPQAEPSAHSLGSHAPLLEPQRTPKTERLDSRDEVDGADGADETSATRTSAVTRQWSESERRQRLASIANGDRTERTEGRAVTQREPSVSKRMSKRVAWVASAAVLAVAVAIGWSTIVATRSGPQRDRSGTGGFAPATLTVDPKNPTPMPVSNDPRPGVPHGIDPPTDASMNPPSPSVPNPSGQASTIARTPAAAVSARDAASATAAPPPHTAPTPARVPNAGPSASGKRPLPKSSGVTDEMD